MDGEHLAELLSAHDIDVRRVLELPRAAGHVPAWALFLDPTRNQRIPARACLRTLPGVASVTFSNVSPWVLFVTAGSRSIKHPRHRQAPPTISVPVVAPGRK
ncbi:hypothetical protein GCM10022223_20040 [Kineosporia mesophila]|uniref:Uncharacterized protein n=1 Tax=Kineosporia mesophila TaxID=566012 RepID=A0ABP6ZBE4_9ACTN|nr:hypothetical protein [Kineosporia mesophila]MCD5350103.1 hypothetical protein [Kineosporia mesophila]